MYYYSASTGGFYSREVNSVIPSDAVAITDAYHQELLDGQSNKKIIVPDASGYPVLQDAVPVAPTAQQNKADAVNRLIVTDWVNQPDVYDTSNNPHLVNRSAFLSYREQVRVYAVNPVAGFINWPVEPVAVWSS